MSMSSRLRQRLTRAFNSEVLVLGTTPTLLANMLDVSSGEGILLLSNAGSASIFFCFGGSAVTPPTLTINNGIPLPVGGLVILDDIGGCAVWGIAAANQTAGSGTRVTGAKTTP